MISQALVLLHIGENDDNSDLLAATVSETNAVDRVISFESAEDSLAYLYAGQPQTAETRCVRPDLILLDLDTPDLDGPGLLQCLRSHPKTLPIPVVVLTTTDDDQTLALAYQLGANGHLMKPASFSDMVTMLAEMSIYWSVAEEPVATA